MDAVRGARFRRAVGEFYGYEQAGRPQGVNAGGRCLVVGVGSGGWLIARFHWVMYLFSAFLVFTGIKMWWAAGQEPVLEANPTLKWIRARIRIAPRYDGEKFFTFVNGVKMATPLFVVIILIGIVDIVFEVDSIPAIFAITTDSFIVLTSNVFAILGLRAMYFLLAGMHERFHLLSYGLAIVLLLIGAVESEGRHIGGL